MVALGILASPRPTGNTASALRDILDVLSEQEVETDTIDLSQSVVEPIGDCRACIEAGACSREDEFEAMMARVYSADLLVLATPLYWYGPSAQLKLFLDRWSCLLDREEEAFRGRMRGKRAVVVVAQGERGFYEAGPCLQMLEWSLRYLDIDLVSRIVVVGHARDDYTNDHPQRAAVRTISQELAAAPPLVLLPPWFHVKHEPGHPLGGVFSP